MKPHVYRKRIAILAAVHLGAAALDVAAMILLDGGMGAPLLLSALLWFFFTGGGNGPIMRSAC